MGIERISLMSSFCCILFVVFSINQLPSNALELRKFDAIYQFGNSLSDTGNFIRMNITSLAGCNTLPYGETYFGFSTGRCSDGLLMVDFIARYLHLPFVKPYLDKNADFSNGVDFAIYGASALSAAALEAKNLTVLLANDSLPVEMGWFKTYLQTITSNSQNGLSKSLFIMGEIGGNDINFSFFGGKSFEFVYSLIPDIIQAVQNAVQELIDVGAKKILVPGNLPIGCLPIYRGIFASNNTSDYDYLNCLKAYNQVVKFQNDRIQKAIVDLKLKNPIVQIAYVDLYSAYTWLIANAAALGFEGDQVFNACCGSASNSCGTNGAPLCTNPKTRISWDGTHPTHQANKVMVTRWVKPILNTFY